MRRHSPLLARLALAWFALFLGAAAASAAIQPAGAAQWVCVGGSMQLLQLGEEAPATPSAAGELDCPLCGADPLPPLAQRQAPTPVAAAALAAPADAERPPSRARAALPARGPPAARSIA